MSITKAVAALANLTKDDARRVYAQDVIRRRLNTTNFGAIGFEEVECGPDAVMTGDGREIVRVSGKAYALRPDVHAEMLARRFEVERQNKQAKGAPVSSKPGEALTSVLCPSCESIMAKSPVCPRCAKGRAGYKVLCICTECGHEVYL